MPKVLITGGTGHIGKALGRKLLDKGYEVAILSRSRTPVHGFPILFWDPENKVIDKEAVESADHIIHLAGANIGNRRWTKKRKLQIIDSRVKPADLIFDLVSESNCIPETFITASATGYYGSFNSEKVFTESNTAADDFLGQTCMDWEGVADKFVEYGVRSVIIRTGVVLSGHGGALARLAGPVRWGIGAALGTGKQYMPWIHMEDLCNIYIHALENKEMHGPHNAVAPEQVTNRDFMKEMAVLLKKPFWLPRIPSLVIRLIFGEMSKTVLFGSRISAEKLLSTGYKFQFPDLGSALVDCFDNRISLR